MTFEKETSVITLHGYNLRPEAIANRIGEGVAAVVSVLAANNKTIPTLKKLDKKPIKNKKPVYKNTPRFQRPPAKYSNHRPYDF